MVERSSQDGTKVTSALVTLRVDSITPHSLIEGGEECLDYEGAVTHCSTPLLKQRSRPSAFLPPRSRPAVSYFQLVHCRINSVRVWPSTRRHLAKTADEGALNPCVEEKVAARGAEGRRDACVIHGAVHLCQPRLRNLEHENRTISPTRTGRR